MKLWQQFKAWIIPFVLAVSAVAAVNKARSLQKKADRVMGELEQHTEHDIDELAVDVEANVTRHDTAQKAAKKANQNAKKRIEDLANTGDDMSDLLHKYRRRRLQHSSDAT